MHWRLETLAASEPGVGWVASGFEFDSSGLGNVCCCDGGLGDTTKDTLAVVGWGGGGAEKVKYSERRGKAWGSLGESER